MVSGQTTAVILLELIGGAALLWYLAEVERAIDYWAAIGLNVTNITVALLIFMRPVKDGGGVKKIPPLLK